MDDELAALHKTNPVSHRGGRANSDSSISGKPA